MPIGYLVLPLLLAYATYFVLAPPAWPRLLKSLGYYFAVINEVPFLALLILVATNWSAFSQGQESSPVGWLALALSLFAAAGLMVVTRRSLRTGEAVVRALKTGLGTTWQAGVEPGSAGRLRAVFEPRALRGPFLIRRRRVKRTANVQYGPAGAYHLLDVYRRRSGPTGCPVLIHLHGGAMVTGKKSRNALPLLYDLADQGWVCISANYRLATNRRATTATYPEAVTDVKRVIAWVRAHGQEHGIDPAQVFVAGGSAGARLATLAALTPNDPRFQPGFEGADTSVAAAIALYGYYEDAWLEARSSIRARAEIPPVFILHGDRDETLPVEGARHFAQKLRSVSPEPVVYAELPGGRHNFDLFHSIRGEAVIAGVEYFTAWVRSDRERVPVPSLAAEPRSTHSLRLDEDEAA